MQYLSAGTGIQHSVRGSGQRAAGSTMAPGRPALLALSHPPRPCFPLQETNEQDETCRFLQVWLTPDRRGHEPQYGSSSYERQDRHNRLLHILGGTGARPDWPGVHAPHSIKLHQVGVLGCCMHNGPASLPRVRRCAQPA